MANKSWEESGCAALVNFESPSTKLDEKVLVNCGGPPIPTDPECLIKVSFYQEAEEGGELPGNDHHKKINVLSTEECLKSAQLNARQAASLMGIFVAVGIVTIILWRLLTLCHDRREYVKFEKERKKAEWSTVIILI